MCTSVHQVMCSYTSQLTVFRVYGKVETIVSSATIVTENQWNTYTCFSIYMYMYMYLHNHLEEFLV